MRRLILALPAAILLTVMASCESIDCPLNNMVYAKFRFTPRITDTLTISAAISEGSDSVLFNRGLNTDSVQLPMSYSHSEDVYYFQFTDTVSTRIDTVTVQKQDRPHFESVDCNPSIFHTITGVLTTTHVIDSIAINNNEVTYDALKPHFIVYTKNTAR